MEIIGAAALIAVGIVLAAVLYGRVHGAGVAAAGAQVAAGAKAVEVVELPERTASLAQREAGLPMRLRAHGRDDFRSAKRLRQHGRRRTDT